MDRRPVSFQIPIGAGNLAAAAAVATFVAVFRFRLTAVVLALGNTGGTSGNTDVDVNRNGASIMPAQALRIAQGAATKYVKAPPAGATGEPSGLVIEPGDVITIDIDAVPGTASKDGRIDLFGYEQGV